MLRVTSLVFTVMALTNSLERDLRTEGMIIGPALLESAVPESAAGIRPSESRLCSILAREGVTPFTEGGFTAAGFVVFATVPVVLPALTPGFPEVTVPALTPGFPEVTVPGFPEVSGFPEIFAVGGDPGVGPLCAAA